MSIVRIEVTPECVTVRSPFHEDFVPAAQRLNGKWEPPVWKFDPRDEQRVRAICRRVYGTDGTDETLVDVRLMLDDSHRSKEDRRNLYACGRQIARVLGRDSGARLAEGVVVLEGSIFSCGSRKNPAIGCVPGTVVEIRDVPIAIVEEGATIIERPQTPNLQALREERGWLEARIAAIDLILKEQGDGE